MESGEGEGNLGGYAGGSVRGEGPRAATATALLAPVLCCLGGSLNQSRVAARDWGLQGEGRIDCWNLGSLSGKTVDFAAVSHLSLEGYPPTLDCVRCQHTLQDTPSNLFPVFP